MIIKSAKDYNWMMAVIILVILATALLLLSAGCGVVFAVIYALLLLIFAMRFWVSVGRTLIFDVNGCTVKFLWITRTYRWKDLKTAHYLDLTNAFGYRQPYKAGAIFSAKQIKIPKWMKPGDYSAFCHPFSCFYVYFDPKVVRKKGDIRIPEIYIVDEEVFHKHLVGWNIELKKHT